MAISPGSIPHKQFVVFSRMRNGKRPRTVNTGRFAHTIYQEDLEKRLKLAVKATEAQRQLEELDEYIKEALRGGARIEAGVHTAMLTRVSRKAFRAAGCSYYRLDVK